VHLRVPDDSYSSIERGLHLDKSEAEHAKFRTFSPVKDISSCKGLCDIFYYTDVLGREKLYVLGDVVADTEEISKKDAASLRIIIRFIIVYLLVD